MSADVERSPTAGQLIGPGGKSGLEEEVLPPEIAEEEFPQADSPLIITAAKKESHRVSVMLFTEFAQREIDTVVEYTVVPTAIAGAVNC